MALEITGTLIKKMPAVTGNSTKGSWQKQEFVIETQDTFPKKICMHVWGADKVSELGSIRDGETIKISFNVESREYNQKWYTDLRAWKIEKGSQNRDQEMVPPEEIYSDNGDSDLPF